MKKFKILVAKEFLDAIKTQNLLKMHKYRAQVHLNLKSQLSFAIKVNAL